MALRPANVFLTYVIYDTDTYLGTVYCESSSSESGAHEMTYFLSCKIIRRKQQQFGLRVTQLCSRRAAAIALSYVCSVGAMYPILEESFTFRLSLVRATRAR